MTLAERAATDLVGRLGSLPVGSLRVFGDFFGKPYDNAHRVESATATGHDLVLTFDDGERLVISEPEAWEFGPSVLRVERATRVAWTWHLYGRPKVESNLRTIEHWIEGGRVHARIDGDRHLYPFNPSLLHPAAEVLAYPAP